MSYPDKWNDSCPLPFRLLHVPTMTSHTWSRGNKYGNVSNPAYNALSYTWGRWKLKEGAKPDIQGLNISGISWAMPRIDPAHFTSDELFQAIQRTANYDASRNIYETEFIWLDVACIDQTPKSEENAREVGRQAKIFKGASRVFAWWTSFSSSSFSIWRSEALNAYSYFLKSEIYDQRISQSPTRYSRNELIAQMAEKVERISLDPWCSSLWTLQEAFLRPDILLLFRDKDEDETGSYPRLNEICEWMTSVQHAVGDAKSPADDILQALKGKIAKLGLTQSGWTRRIYKEIQGDSWIYLRGPVDNPFHLLGYSRARKTLHQEDRVYAIMQVFDLQLGKSNRTLKRKEFSYEELYYQLGHAILETYPIASQLMIQSISCPRGSGWMLHPESTIAVENEAFWKGLQEGDLVKNLSLLSTRQICGQVWGYFEGPMISFIHLSLGCGPLSLKLDQRWQSSSTLDTAPESAKEEHKPVSRKHHATSAALAERVKLYQSTVKANEEKRSAVDGFARRMFPQLKVLLLGTSKVEGDDFISVFGVCLNLHAKQEELECYYRIGYVVFRQGAEWLKGILEDTSGTLIARKKGIFG